MFDEKVVYPEQYPIQERNRKSTDVCCTILGAIFALTMFIVACCMWNKGTINPDLDSFNRNFFSASRLGPDTQCNDGQIVFSDEPGFEVSINLSLGIDLRG